MIKGVFEMDMKKQRGNYKKLLYVCRDCKARKYVKTVYNNRKGGPRCMECGGVLDPDSQNAVHKGQLATEKQNGKETGSILLNSKRR